MTRKVTKLSKYGVEIRVEIWTTFEASSEHDALEQAHEWVSLEYGDLSDKADYTVTELK
jgi:hypothetical protein